MSVPDAIHKWSHNESQEMGILTSGSLPPNPTELLASERMGQILEELSGLADYVVIDTPPMIVSDAQVLSPWVSGIVFVIKPGHTHSDVARTTVDQLIRANARVLGVVMNSIPRNRSYYYGGYSHYAPNYYNGKNQYTGYGTNE